MSIIPQRNGRPTDELEHAVEAAPYVPQDEAGTATPFSQPERGRGVAEARGLAVAYTGRTVLANVSLSLEPAQIYILLGPNGSGKTTLLQAFYGHVPLSAGTILVDGADPRRSARARRSIGLVPQDIALYPTLTTRENLECFGRLADLPRRRVRQRVDQLIGECRLTDVAHRQVHTLSGGFQRRVNLAVALLTEPALLLLDEPTVGIDRDAAAAIAEVLKAQRANGAAVLMVSHDFDQCAALADRVGIMIAGRLVRDERFQDLLTSEGPHREMIVALERAPTDADRVFLASLGFEASGDPLLWAAPGDAGGDSVDEMVALLDGTKLAVREVGLRRRGLATIYERVVAAEGRRP